MLHTTQQNNWIRGFRLNNRQGGSLEISHLLYADDAIILCDAEIDQIRMLRVILTIFEGISGLNINWGEKPYFPN